MKRRRDHGKSKGRRAAGSSKGRRGQRRPDASAEAVTEFFLEVAGALDLPPKALPDETPLETPPPVPSQQSRATPPPSRAVPAPRPRTRWWLPAVAAAMLLAVGRVQWGTWARPSVPQEFRGTWVSRDAKYAGRIIVFSAETVEIVAVGSAVNGPVAVTRTKVDTTTSGIRLRCAYATGDGEQSLEVTLHPGRPETMTLLHPPDVVWERGESGLVSKPERPARQR